MIVLDSSAVVDALALAPGTESLRAHLAADELHASSLLDFEVVSAVRGLTRGGHLSLARAQDLLSDFDDLLVRRWSFGDPLRRRALALADSVSAYDAAYVGLAEVLECPLVTRDGRLARSNRA